MLRQVKTHNHVVQQSEGSEEVTVINEITGKIEKASLHDNAYLIYKPNRNLELVRVSQLFQGRTKDGNLVSLQPNTLLQVNEREIFINLGDNVYRDLYTHCAETTVISSENEGQIIKEVIDSQYKKYMQELMRFELNTVFKTVREA